MNDTEKFHRKQNQLFILVCINFVMFVILFGGLGFVTYQSASLVSRLKGDLHLAEQSIAQLQDRFHNMDVDKLVDRLVVTASKSLEESIKNVVKNSDLTTPLTQASERMAATHEVIEQTGTAIQGIHETVKGLDNEEIARLVSYNILKGLGDGFQQAAEAGKPRTVIKQD
ncbi:MAG: hypothetical protein ABFS19_09735 [Thermodesulfobacteriota bacterium]